MAVGCARMPLVYRGMAAECPNGGSVRLQRSVLSVRWYSSLPYRATRFLFAPRRIDAAGYLNALQSLQNQGKEK